MNVVDLVSKKQINPNEVSNNQIELSKQIIILKNYKNELLHKIGKITKSEFDHEREFLSLKGD